MMKASKALLPALAALLLAGCASSAPTRSSITNLTPPEISRNPENQYVVECVWSSNQQSIRKESFKAYVMIGLTFYEMRRIPMMKDRWEAIVPGPEGSDILNYRIKFDYLYNRIPEPRADSKLSQQYQLRIVD